MRRGGRSPPSVSRGHSTERPTTGLAPGTHRPSLGLAPRGTAVSPHPPGLSAGWLGNRRRPLRARHPHLPGAVSFLRRCPPSREVPCGTAAPVRWAELPREHPGSPRPPRPWELVGGGIKRLGLPLWQSLHLPELGSFGPLEPSEGRAPLWSGAGTLFLSRFSGSLKIVPRTGGNRQQDAGERNCPPHL